MALWNITTKYDRNTSTNAVSKGMTVQVSSVANPLYSAEGRKLIAQAYKGNFAVDLEKVNMINLSYLDVKKV